MESYIVAITFELICAIIGGLGLKIIQCLNSNRRFFKCNCYDYLNEINAVEYKIVHIIIKWLIVKSQIKTYYTDTWNSVW